MRALATNQHLSRYLIHPIQHAVNTPASDYYNLICSTRLPSMLQPRKDTQQPLSYLTDFFKSKTHPLSTQAKGALSSPLAKLLSSHHCWDGVDLAAGVSDGHAPGISPPHSNHHLFIRCADHAHRLRPQHPADIMTRLCSRHEVDGALC